MTYAEFDAYVKADAAMINKKYRVASPCADCTVAFAKTMRAVGCCDGEPRDGRPGRLRRTLPVVVVAA